MKINLGCGKQKTEGWIGINKSNANINYDFNNLGKLPINNNSCEVIFCGHVIEHLTDNIVLKLFKECYRILKSEGIFRIITPDFDLFAKLYLKGDIKEFNKFKISFNKEIETKGFNIAERFINQFLSWVELTKKGKIKKGFYKIKKDEFDYKIKNDFNNLKTQKNKEEYINWMKNLLPDLNDIVISYLHINAFNFLKIKSFLKKAGFSNIWKSNYKESKYKELNILNWDKFINRSICVECEK